MNVFVDSNYFVATLLPRDQWQERSRQTALSGVRLITSNLVVNETISLIQSRGFFSESLEFLRWIRDNPDVNLVHVDPAIQAEAWELFHRWGGMGANAVDCSSFAVMRRLSIRKAFSFDHHFSKAGFEILR